MKERPIIFNEPMARAVAAGQKTMTRRPVKINPAGRVKEPGGTRQWHPEDRNAILGCPFGRVGNWLWVRESWRTVEEADSTPPRGLNPAFRLWYEADGDPQPGFGKLRPSIHMPRWASRIALEITDVRLERLQDISEADAIAEGIQPNAGPRCDFAAVWDAAYGNGAWYSNPWVWVIEFQK